MVPVTRIYRDCVTAVFDDETERRNEDGPTWTYGGHCGGGELLYQELILRRSSYVERALEMNDKAAIMIEAKGRPTYSGVLSSSVQAGTVNSFKLNCKTLRRPVIRGRIGRMCLVAASCCFLTSHQLNDPKTNASHLVVRTRKKTLLHYWIMVRQK